MKLKKILINTTPINRMYIGTDVVLGSTPPGSTLINGVTSYYKFDETSGTVASDSVGSIDGTLTQGSFTSGSIINNGVYFPTAGSAGQGITYGNNFNFISGQASTYNVWLNSETIGNNVMLMTKGSDYYYFLPSMNKVEINARHISAATKIQANFNYTFVASEWYMFTLARNGGNDITDWVHYINGVETPWTNVIQNNLDGDSGGASTFQLGEYINNAMNPQGYIDEFGVWDRQLSQSEITELYNDSAGKQYPFA